MDSLYAKYIKERTDDEILENEYGFATYRFLNENQCYIVDIFVVESMRKKGVASAMADHIADLAKEKGCTALLGTVNPSCKGATESIQTLIAFGMTVSSSTDNIIIFKKGI